MLTEGFHKSFSELFALIKQQNERRLKAGPESVLWNMVMLETETEKMETLKKYLTEAETALRRGEIVSLASYFTNCVKVRHFLFIFRGFSGSLQLPVCACSVLRVDRRQVVVGSLLPKLSLNEFQRFARRGQNNGWSTLHAGISSGN